MEGSCCELHILFNLWITRRTLQGARTRHALTGMRIGGLRLAILFGLAGFSYTPLYLCVGKMGLKDENRNFCSKCYHGQCRMHVPSKMVTDEYRFSGFIFGLTKYHYVDCSMVSQQVVLQNPYAYAVFFAITRSSHAFPPLPYLNELLRAAGKVIPERKA